MGRTYNCEIQKIEGAYWAHNKDRVQGAVGKTRKERGGCRVGRGWRNSSWVVI